MERDFIQRQVGEQASPLDVSAEPRPQLMPDQPGLDVAAGLGTGLAIGLSCRFDHEI